MEPLCVQVKAGDSEYPILIKAGLLTDLGERLKSLLPSSRVCVVTDQVVAKHYLMQTMKNLEAAEFSVLPPIIVPSGEETKSFAWLQYVIDRCLSYKLDRKSTLVALGGGIVGDLTGFAASVLLRGIPFVQVPTTLLSQVDSSVGGKTGINTTHGKNLVGSFYQPRAVFIDTNTLKTLPERELKAGYAEILKYALINKPDFFTWLEKNGEALLAGDAVLQKEAIAISCQAKAEIVEADEKEEKDIRAFLNLGHTFGHALEALGGYDGRILHGEAVSIGMVWAFELSCRLGLCQQTDVERVIKHIKSAGLTLVPPFPVSVGEVLSKMEGDKKNTGGTITLILVEGIGKAVIRRDISKEVLRAFLADKFT